MLKRVAKAYKIRETKEKEMINLTVAGVDEKQIKTIMETSNPLCDGLKGEYRTMGEKFSL